MNPKRLLSNTFDAAAAVLHQAAAPLRRVWPRPREAVLALLALVVIAAALATYSPAVARWASTWVSGNKYASAVDGLVNPFRNRHTLLSSGVPVYDLKVDKADLRAMESKVQEALKVGWMRDEFKLWVNGKLTHEGKKYDVKVRVRGDLPNHWNSPKKSWAIRFTPQKVKYNGKQTDEPVFFQEGRGMARRQIALIIPSDREFAIAPFINRVLRQEGLVTPQDRFVVLRINGVVQGVYYEVEGFDNTLLSAQQRPETTVFGQNDRPMHFEQYTKLGTAAAADTRFNMTSLRRDVDSEGDLGMRAMQVLFEYAQNPTPAGFRRARTVLDWQRYLKFRAMTTLLNTNHVRFGSDNFKLYFDASRGLLEPIPWDCHLVKLPREPGTIDFWNSHGPDQLQIDTLGDPALRLERNKVLWSLLDDGGKRLLDTYNQLHDHLRPLAWNDVLVTPIQGQKMDELKKVLQHNVARVHQVLGASAGGLTMRRTANDLAELELTCENFSGIEYREIALTDKKLCAGEYRLIDDANGNGRIDEGESVLATAVAEKGTVRIKVDLQVLPGVRYGRDTIDARDWEYLETLVGRKRLLLAGKLTPERRDPLAWTPPAIRVGAVNAVTGAKVPSAPVDDAKAKAGGSIGIVAYDASDPLDLESVDRSLAEFLRTHPQFQASSSAPGAAELSGKVEIRQFTVVPKSVPLVIVPGTELIIHPDVSLLCYGGLTAVGSAEQPIRIRAVAPNRPFGTFANVRPTERKVVLRHVDLSGGGQAQANCTLFTGGFAVHHGDLDIADCVVHDMASEDGMNVKKGRIDMTRCLIRGTDSDALDLDFCTGQVSDSRFEQVKGDGVDLSGSRVLVANCFFNGLGDKGTSVGEESYPTLVNNLYFRCNIGVSCKDLSHPLIAHCTFVGNQTAIEAKRKKPEFGGSGGEFFNCVFSGNKSLVEEDFFSQQGVQIVGSLIDRPSRFDQSFQGQARFAAPDRGDYRVLRQSLPQGYRPAALPKGLSGVGGSAELGGALPGILALAEAPVAEVARHGLSR